MADLKGVFGYYRLTQFVNELNLEGYEEALVSRNVPGRTQPGETAMWTVRKPRVNINKTFVGPDSASIPLDTGDAYQRSMTIPYRFVNKRFKGGELNALVPLTGGDIPDNGKSLVDSEVREMDLVARQMTNEYLVVNMLLGVPFNIAYGNNVASVNVAIDPGVPVGSRRSAVSTWTGTSANIYNDVQQMVIAMKKRGAKPTQMLMNGYTAGLIHRNTTMQAYFQYQALGVKMIQEGELPMIAGVKPVIVDVVYAETSQLDAFDTELLPNGTVIFIPDWPVGPNGWIEMQRGTFLVPNDNQSDLISQDGVAVWSRTTDDPPCKIVFERVLEFPVLREPWRVGILQV